MLQRLNTYRAGYLALAVGGTSFVTLSRLLTDPNYLVALMGAIVRAHAGMATPADLFTIAQLAAGGFGLLLSFAAAYLSRPRSV